VPFTVVKPTRHDLEGKDEYALNIKTCSRKMVKCMKATDPNFDVEKTKLCNDGQIFPPDRRFSMAAVQSKLCEWAGFGRVVSELTSFLVVASAACPPPVPLSRYFIDTASCRFTGPAWSRTHRSVCPLVTEGGPQPSRRHVVQWPDWGAFLSWYR